MNKVAVLLAAYNGEQWIQEQISSILKQKNVDVTLFISIDQSSDNTLMLCEELALSEPRINLLPYGDIFGGAALNFYRLIKDVDFTSFDYISFADQDDIWLEDKLQRASLFLEKYDVYSSNVIAFWPNGKAVLINKAQPQVKYDFLFEAAGPGCTYVIHRDVAIEFKKFIVSKWQEVKKIELHDWLFYSFSRVKNFQWVIDERPGMYYRQHQNNQVGANNTMAGAVKRLNLIKCKWYREQICRMISVFEDEVYIPFYRELKTDSYFDKLKILPYLNKIRRRPRDRMYLAIAILIGYF
ncbi:Spore coat polysaccharide biosynthesis protein spsA [Escherichia coli]|uniref:glycosyltransferase n=1 Tax=Escherichia coli TaxID=562 RepID=UPI000694CB48|nr:glycosyltransferase [Escherichia coli]EFA4218603.1 glycosyltransferase [Escherichia coli O19:H42]EFA4305088.1 glycosyltransferase [Escherichia coli O19]AVL10709.1 glycosyl transferase [Escherichia coli]AYL86304.1 glycosyl transferase [Escherichia coli]EEV5997773.1 glycosyltransferase [Escherichia coli]